MVFLVWLGERLALEAAAQHQELNLQQGQVIHVRSSMGDASSSFQIQCTLQQRTQHSAAYKAICSLTQETVVVKLGPLPNHRSQAELLGLDGGAWGQVLLRCIRLSAHFITVQNIVQKVMHVPIRFVLEPLAKAVLRR